jgi:hypothetical protein
MKRNTALILALGILASTTVFLAGCKQNEDETMTVTECMTEFRDDVNSLKWSDLKDLTHSGATQYNTMDASDWSGEFSTVKNFTLTSTPGTTTTATCNSDTYTFTLAEDGSDNWKVRRITRASDGGTVFN